MDSSVLRSRSPRELTELAVAEGIEGAAAMRRAELVVALLQHAARRGDELVGDGVLEVTGEGFGFLRSPRLSYQPGADDVYVSPSQIRRFELRTGDTVGGVIRPPKEGERFVALLKVSSVNHGPSEGRRPPVDFLELEVAPPSRWLELTGASDRGRWSAPAAAPLLAAPVLRTIDLLAPIPAGGRVLVLGPAGSGRTALSLALAGALAARHGDLAVQVVLLDQPREDLADLSPPAGVELAATALDEPPVRHGQVAELALARAQRLAEAGRHVVLVVDSLTRLSRALHAAQPRPAGALEPAAVQRARRLLGAGRVLAAGGSLTIIATARSGGSAIDAAAVDELETAASSIVRLEPAHAAVGLPLDVQRTFARRTARYLSPAHHTAVERLRGVLTAFSPADAARHVAELATAELAAVAT